MIIFYHKVTGKIEGTIAGRVHDKQHLNMWIGDKAETDRIVIQWKPVRWLDKDRRDVPEGSEDVMYTIYDIDHQQKDLIAAMEKDFSVVPSRYRVNVETKQIIPV